VKSVKKVISTNAAVARFLNKKLQRKQNRGMSKIVAQEKQM
jgi:hypothetical protein